MISTLQLEDRMPRRYDVSDEEKSWLLLCGMTHDDVALLEELRAFNAPKIEWWMYAE